RMLLLTGARRGEVAGARWSEFDLAARVWVIPRSRAKSDAEYRVPLTDDLLALLATLPRYRAGDFVFTTSFGCRPVSGFSKATAGLLRLVGNPVGFALHDLRRPMRTRLSEIGVRENVAEICIGHAKRGIVRVYDQARHANEVRSAFEAWHARLHD